MATTTTIHFEGKFKGKGFAVPYCSRFTMRARGGETTTDLTKVNCTRCAKQLDITPAAKVVSSTRGTCQCCFGAYETRSSEAKSWHVVLHGYKRPGHGYIVGQCRGNGYVPYEVSCEQTKVWLQELKDIRAAKVAYLADLNEGRVTKLGYLARTGERVHTAYARQYVTKLVEVVKGDERKPNPFTAGWEGIPSFEELLKQAVREVEMTIRAIDGDITFLDGKIQTWKPVAFPLAK